MKTKIQQLIKLVEKSNINELEVSTFWGGQKIRVTKNNISQSLQPLVMQQPIVQQSQPAVENIVDVQKTEINEKPKNEIKEDISLSEDLDGENFTAPLVGTYYVASKPGAPPFVKEGDSVTKGQILCIIEAMKIFNEIEAEHSGVIKKILVDDGTPVEYGQPLMIIG
ncbi:MAG: acetyl-CoA carboxylase, biotin carboxyl carrier protein [Candidatus Marinimicrobia bacterium]|nr:acetyl-CoA carboxylase, biotin carboxyl carrier protein [Candidatus Neomarinimicrobiota bacterium]|tara:strand:- start:758 stop:1258 length:501 start_codon:yes stop_codon:yes gene_type:complete